MCHYTYALFTCCSEPKEYDGVDVFNVIYCRECPLSSDSRLYAGDFFHCPHVTSRCLGDSDWLCPECSHVYNIPDANDDVDREKDPEDTYSDAESEDEGFPIDWEEVYGT